MLDQLKELDEQLFFLLNGAGSPYLDEVMYWLSDKYIWFPLYVFLLYYLYRKNGLDFYQPVIAIVLIIIISDQFTSGFMKPFFERYRPCRDSSIQHLVYMLDHCGGRYGFASSHAANTFGLATFFYLREKSTLSVILLFWALMVSYSRIYLGSHYPGDILAGALVGMLAAYLMYRLLSKIQPKIKVG